MFSLRTLAKNIDMARDDMVFDDLRQIERERLSWAIAQQIRQSIDLQKILSTTVTEVRQFLQTDRVVIYRFNPDWSGVVVAESVDAPWISTLDVTIADPCFQNNWVELYKQGRVKAIANVNAADLNPCHIELLAKYQVQANMVVPILQGNGEDSDATQPRRWGDVAIPNRLWGLLIAHHCASPRQWEPLETDLLLSLSTQVALAIQQAELYQQARTQIGRQRRMQGQLSKLNRSLRVLLDCNKLLVQATHESKLLQDICQVIITVGGYQLAWVGLTDAEATKPLSFRGQAFEAREFELPPFAESELAEVNAEFITEALRTQHPSFTQNLTLKSSSTGVEQNYAVAIALPLQEQDFSGVLTIYSKVAQAFDLAEVELLKELAENLSHGLMSLRARLMLKQANEKLSELEAELRQSLAQEKELSDLKSRIITTVSHEYRTPLTTIQSSAELLEVYRHKWDNDKQLKHFHRIQSTVKHMTTLINDVLFVNKAEFDKLDFNPALIDLASFFQELVDELQCTVSNSHYLTFVNLHECGQGNFDVKLLRQILTNLISNAIKYSPKGGTVKINLTCEDNHIIFQVIDQGIGIPIEDQEHLFKSFNRASNVGTIAGTGLGLSIVKKCVERQGGQITVKSEIGVGTTFTVRLPLDITK